MTTTRRTSSSPAGPDRPTPQGRDHLWMHFTRHSSTTRRRARAGHRARRGRLHLGRPGQALPRRPRRPVRRAGRPRPHRARRGDAAQAGRGARLLPAVVLRPPHRHRARRAAGRTRPGDLNRVFFTTGGGEAVETAWKLAKQYFKLTGKPTKHKVISRSVAYHGTPQGALSITGIPAAKEMFEPLVPGALQGAQHQLLPRPRARRRREGLRPLGRRPHRRGDRVRGPGHRRRRLPRAGAELRRLLPAAARATSSGCARSATSTTCCSSPTRRSAPSAASATCSPAPLRLPARHHHLRQGHDLRLLPARRDDRQRPAVRAVPHGTTYVPARLHLRRAPGLVAVAMANLDIFEREGLNEHVRENEGAFRATLEKLLDLPIVGDVRGEGTSTGSSWSRTRHQGDLRRRRVRAAAARLPVQGALRRRLYCRADDRGDPVVQLAPPLIIGQPSSTRSSEVPAAVDVVIVGGGLTGLWSAYYLLERQPDLSVLVLEAEHVGFGASGRNGGWVSALWPVSAETVAAEHGRDATLDLLAALRETVDEVGARCAAEGIEAGFAKGGTLALVRSPPRSGVPGQRSWTPGSGISGPSGSTPRPPARDWRPRASEVPPSTRTARGSIPDDSSTVSRPPSRGAVGSSARAAASPASRADWSSSTTAGRSPPVTCCAPPRHGPPRSPATRVTSLRSTRS
jgi:hypothetical protein